MGERESISFWNTNDGSNFKSQVRQLVKHLEVLANDLDIDMNIYHSNPDVEGPVIEKDLSKIREDVKKIIKYRFVLNNEQKQLLNAIEDKLFVMQDPNMRKFDKYLDELIILVQNLEDLTKQS